MGQRQINSRWNITTLREKVSAALGRMDLHIKPAPTPVKRWLILLDIARMKVLHDYSAEDYFLYQFHCLKMPARKSFIGQNCGIEKIMRYLNDTDDRVKFDNKALFNALFSRFLHRDWLLFPDCTFDQFCGFCKKNLGFIKKPPDQNQGKGIQKILIDNNANLPELYATLKEEPCLVEEIIIQDAVTASFNPSSVNTIRVYSVLLHDKVHITDAYLRMGVGDTVVDNFHHGGIGAKIDPDTGIVITVGRNFSGGVFTFHPATNKLIEGFEIPRWAEIRETVEEAALVVPSVRYVAWDLAVNNRGDVCLVEGNDKGCFNFQQAIDLKGKKSNYETLLGIKL